MRRKVGLLVGASARNTRPVPLSASTAPRAKPSADSNAFLGRLPSRASDHSRSGGRFDVLPAVTARTIALLSAASELPENGNPPTADAGIVATTAGGVRLRSVATTAEGEACWAPSL